MADPNVDLEYVYLFNVPIEMRALDQTLSKYYGTKVAIEAEDILECIFYLIASGDGFIDLGEVYEFIDNITEYEEDPDDKQFINERDIHEIIQIAESIMYSEGNLILDEVERTTNQYKVSLYFAKTTRIGRAGYLEVRLQYQRDYGVRIDESLREMSSYNT